MRIADEVDARVRKEALILGLHECIDELARNRVQRDDIGRHAFAVALREHAPGSTIRTYPDGQSRATIPDCSAALPASATSVVTCIDRFAAPDVSANGAGRFSRSCSATWITALDRLSRNGHPAPVTPATDCGTTRGTGTDGSP